MLKVRKTRVSTVPKSETKEQRFVRLAKPRVQNAIKRIQQVGNCSGVAYVYTPEQAAKIVSALSQAVDGVKAAFDKVKLTTNSFDF
jgi:hypothetical protein